MENNSAVATSNTDYTALMKFFALSPSARFEKDGERIVLTHENKSMTLSSAQLALLVAKGLITRKNKIIELTQVGRNYLPPNQIYRNFQISVLESDLVVVNNDESPLTALANRKMTNGAVFLQSNEFEAGERIRSDFTRAMMMPRISANWQESVSRGVRGNRVNGAEDLTHNAIAARDRFDAALHCLGRDLAGVVTDICCYLKGFEQVEMERKWPKRSAKFMLKAALAILALHYNPPAKAIKRTHKWGTSDYRPNIT